MNRRWPITHSFARALQRVGAATKGGMVHRQPDRSAGERHAVSAGVWPHRAGVDLAMLCWRCLLPATIAMRRLSKASARDALFLPLRIAED